MAQPRTITIFCSASDSADLSFADVADDFLAYMVLQKMELIYGGGQKGLMGAIANRMLKKGGVVRGIIPQGLFARERVHTGLTELVTVGDLMERKRQMILRGDLFLALPGGVGTLDEILEILTWKHLQIVNKPIVLWNMNDFWQPFLTMLRQMESQQVIASRLFNEFQVVRSTGELIKYIETL